MASSSTFLTIPRPFLNRSNASTLSVQRFPASRRSSLKINAIAKKWEPTKVFPQADRVLIRLEELPDVLFLDINAYEVDLGTDAKHCFCKASDLLAVVE